MVPHSSLQCIAYYFDYREARVPARLWEDPFEAILKQGPKKYYNERTTHDLNKEKDVRIKNINSAYHLFLHITSPARRTKSRSHY